MSTERLSAIQTKNSSVLSGPGRHGKCCGARETGGEKYVFSAFFRLNPAAYDSPRSHLHFALLLAVLRIEHSETDQAGHILNCSIGRQDTVCEALRTKVQSHLQLNRVERPEPMIVRELPNHALGVGIVPVCDRIRLDST